MSELQELQQALEVLRRQLASRGLSASDRSWNAHAPALYDLLGSLIQAVMRIEQVVHGHGEAILPYRVFGPRTENPLEKEVTENLSLKVALKAVGDELPPAALPETVEGSND